VRRFLSNAGLTIASFAIAFAIGEVVVRALYKEDSVLFPRYQTDYHYGRYTIRGIRPNAEFWHTSAAGSWKFVTNSKGFRSTKEFAYAKPPGTLRVLALGDSHTQGYEVRQEATFSAAVERYLAFRNVKAEVINTGVSGFSTAEELVLLENEGYKYHPDLVVLGFSPNDYEDNLKADLFALDAEQRLRERKYAHIPGVRIQRVIYSLAPVRWLSENSYVYSFVFNGVWENAKVWFRKSAVRQAFAETEYAVETGPGPTAQQIELAAALIERMQRFCVERGIRLIVVDIPRRDYGRLYHFSSALMPALRERLDAAGIEYVPAESLLGAVEGAAEIHVAYGHRHITETTHALIGAEIGRRLLGPAR
jgi:hypothetical protein